MANEDTEAKCVSLDSLEFGQVVDKQSSSDQGETESLHTST